MVAVLLLVLKMLAMQKKCCRIGHNLVTIIAMSVIFLLKGSQVEIYTNNMYGSVRRLCFVNTCDDEVKSICHFRLKKIKILMLPSYLHTSVKLN